MFEKIKKYVKNNKLFVALIVFVIGFNLMFTSYRISGSSMEPNYHNGNIGIGIKHFTPERFDVVVTKNKLDNRLFIKRIIGLPGDKLEFKDGQLFINDEKIDVPFEVNGETVDFFITLKEDEYYLLGDNRSNSVDSRLLGPFNRNQLVAKSLH